MSNWCSNSVDFRGKRENLSSLLKVFKEMRRRCDELSEGVIPVIQEGATDGYYFYISIDDDNVDDEAADTDELFVTVRYETKWSPNPKNVEWLARKMDVDFVQDYEESGNLVYGQYRLVNTSVDEDDTPVLEHRFLTNDEYQSCKYITDSEETIAHNKGDISDEEYDRLVDEEDWSECDDYEKLSDTLDEKEWENVY